MALVLGFLGLLLLAAIFLPQWWVRRVMRAHAGDRADFPGTGGELARHLLDRARLANVRVELAPPGGDHYDPIDKVVRLSPDNHDGRSITAIAVAAHEASHAMQDADGDRLLATRLKLAGSLRAIEVAAAIVLALAPVVMLVVKSPVLLVLQIGVAVALLGSRVLVHLLTLPVELDASFARALPILEKGGFLPAEDLPKAKSVLRAAALTYVASALVSLLDIARLLRVLRF
ncbi:zinc metallopeptidase [Salinarimonas rosea]|uniref:zinc metallopeptidase n=1 Tax=Salinarimonas rosea TaxID=552063 RepID=UPI0003FEACE1|nr:zinc metallopeptidase [Salinarimonas rosea]